MKMSDMPQWQRSEAYLVRKSRSRCRTTSNDRFVSQEYLGFVLALNEAAQGRNNSSVDVSCLSPVVPNLLKLLDKLDKMVDDTPPIEQPQRFGNQAFRRWIEKLKEVGVLIQMHHPDRLRLIR